MRRILPILSVIAALGIGACGGSDSDTSPTNEPAAVVPSAGATTLATATLEDGRTVELQSFLSESAVEKYAADYQDPGFRATVPPPCLMLTGVGGQKRQCGTPFETDVDSAGQPIVVDSIRAGAIARARPGAPLEVYGPTPAATEIVFLAFVNKGVRERVRAVVFLPTDERKLKEAGFRDPFGYFFAELPTGASDVTATAYSANRKLGSASFDRLIRTSHPRIFIEGKP